MTSITKTTDPHQGEPMEQPQITPNSSISLTLVGIVIGWVVAALMAYSAFDSRVAVMENQMQQFRADVTEMKGDIKTLLRHQQ